MQQEIKKLNDFQKWFNKYIRKNFGKKCSDFVWDCPACRAHFVKEIFCDFVNDLIETENWVRKQNTKSKTVRNKK
jgi:hypothetical protein